MMLDKHRTWFGISINQINRINADQRKTGIQDVPGNYSRELSLWENNFHLISKRFTNHCFPAAVHLVSIIRSSKDPVIVCGKASPFNLVNFTVNDIFISHKEHRNVRRIHIVVIICRATGISRISSSFRINIRATHKTRCCRFVCVRCPLYICFIMDDSTSKLNHFHISANFYSECLSIGQIKSGCCG